MSTWQLIKIQWYVSTHSKVQKNFNFSDDIIEKIRSKHGKFFSKFDCVLSILWKFLMNYNKDKVSLFNIILNAKNRVSFVNEK